MFDGRAQERVSNPGECSGGVILAIAKGRVGVFVEVGLLELSTCVVEGAELDRYACTDTDEWC
jgi:hypothetical protein